MNLFKAYSIVLLLTLLCNSCEEDSFFDARYNYTGYDSLGVNIVNGSLSILYEDAEEISGNWSFEVVGNPQDIGPQVGSGELVGFLTDTSFSANLNPQMADNNVNLFGEKNGDLITGTWSFSGIAGVLNWGSFTAEL